MDILKDLSDTEVRTLAGSSTPAPMAGVWVLTAPDGQTWTGDSPIKCAHEEMNSRVPPQVALARIRRSLIEEDAECEQQRAEFRRALRPVECSHTGMCYGDEKRGDLTGYTRGWGDCLKAVKSALGIEP